MAHYRLGMIDQAYKKLQKPIPTHPYAYWKLVAELAILMGDKSLAKYCYRIMVAVYPDMNKDKNLASLKGM